MIDTARVGEVIAQVGTDGFSAALDDAMRGVAPFDLSAIIVYPDEAHPLLLHDGLNAVSDAGAMEAYLGGTYLLDAVYAACKARIGEGLYRLADLAPDAFFEGEYFNSSQVHPCISLESGVLAEEIAFLIRFPAGHFGGYSLMRSNGRARFSDDEIMALAAYAPIVQAAVRRNWAGRDGARQAPTVGDTDVLEGDFQSFAADTLSPREQVIVSLVLRGHSSGSVGLRLGITEGTVKNHRKSIHTKLEISSQAELFAMFLRHLRKT